MAEKKAKTSVYDSEPAEAIVRIYEAGYHISPEVKEEDLDGTISKMRKIIEKADGTLISEGTPVLMKLSFPIFKREGEKTHEYDRGYYGWLKFEASPECSEELRDALLTNTNIVRSSVIRTLREDTRAKIKAPTLREVRRTDGPKMATRRVEAPSAPVSEEKLDKALETLTLE